MALLYRLVKLPDRFQTHVFTFVVTKSVTRDPDRDVTSKEFACGHQKWSITFSRTDKMLGAYLVWKSASESVRVYVDFTFTILNREHFSVNESFAGKQVSTYICMIILSRTKVPKFHSYCHKLGFVYFNHDRLFFGVEKREQPRYSNMS